MIKQEIEKALKTLENLEKALPNSLTPQEITLEITNDAELSLSILDAGEEVSTISWEEFTAEWFKTEILDYFKDDLIEYLAENINLDRLWEGVVNNKNHEWVQDTVNLDSWSEW